MMQATYQSTKTSTIRSEARATSRILAMDHLRAALVTLVVLHHVAIVYGAAAPFYYVEPPFTDPLAGLVLLLFALFNQAWFMGALFLLAGYFTPGSYDRKGMGAFLKGRALRLGIPLLAFYFILGPLSALGYWQMPAVLTGITEPINWRAYPHLIGMGPLWFVAMLLILDLGYVSWRLLTGTRPSTTAAESTPPRSIGIGFFILALALVTYLLRRVIPLGVEVLDFPTLAYLPQYLSFFVLGIVAFRRRWLHAVPNAWGGAGLAMALVATILLFPLALSGRWFSLAVSETGAFVGNGTWQSAVYALWDATFAVGMVLASITFFRRVFSGVSRVGSFFSQQSYAVYILHTPVLVWIAIALQDLSLAPLLKSGVVALIVIPICFVAAYFARKVPLVSRIL